ncbi:MarR family winged helix-turn-helix transcriptional regulator [Corynebacterium endometrii]|uniref:Transcriptional repressor MprA n=1 Tax=Corynebacterium endometrii TaxID=2488819 RepID=A0A4P7QEV9_9CORY|nr:MarR family winged helix-turn-helix transcriptional regulator [Corynebacterium endometrii]QCB28222.1 transcriptional repressor MprA [Corynebacterium endometrii]
MTAQTRWLGEEEQELWRLVLSAIRKIGRGMEETLIRCSNLTASEYAVLVSLTESNEEVVRVRDLCKELEWDRSRASHQITRMEKRGLVTKAKDPNDARGVVVEVTEQGKRDLANAVPEHVESVRRLVFDHLDQRDVEALRRFFEGVMEVDNIPGYEGFVPDELLSGGQEI